MHTHGVCDGAWQDLVLSLGDRWQSQAGLGEWKTALWCLLQIVAFLSRCVYRGTGRHLYDSVCGVYSFLLSQDVAIMLMQHEHAPAWFWALASAYNGERRNVRESKRPLCTGRVGPAHKLLQSLLV